MDGERKTLLDLVWEDRGEIYGQLPDEGEASLVALVAALEGERGQTL